MIATLVTTVAIAPLTNAVTPNLVWGQPQQIDPDGGGGLGPISCVSGSWCLALSGADAYIRIGSSWTRGPRIPDSVPDPDGSWSWNSLSCTSTFFCAAGASDPDGQQGEVALFNGSSWSAPAIIDHTAGVTAISCVSSSFCAVSDSARRAILYNGSSWTMSQVLDSAPSLESGADAISCASPSFCVLSIPRATSAGPQEGIDYTTDVVSYSGSGWSAPSTLDQFGVVLSVSCPTTTFCMAYDSFAGAIVYNGATWTWTQAVNGSGIGRLVSCGSPTFCVAVNSDGTAVHFNGADWAEPPTSATQTDGTFVSGSLSCTPDGSCALTYVDSASDGAVASYFNGAWTQSTNITGPRRGEPTRVSCASSTFCIATDVQGNFLRYNGTSWSAPAPISAGAANPPAIESLSCPSASFCMAVGVGAEAWTYNGSTWSGPVVVEAAETQRELTAVSCVSAQFCLAADEDDDNFNSYLVTFNGTSWSTRIPFKQNTLVSSLSCVTTTFCAAGDWDGQVSMFDGTTWSPRLGEASSISQISCVSTAFCAMTDFDGGAATFDGTSWSAVTSLGDGDVQSFVSCASNTLCAAFNLTGDAAIYNGAGWSSPVTIDPSAPAAVWRLADISCPANDFCVAVDPDGNAIIGRDIAVPAAPTAVGAVASNGAATVFWTAPSSDGGSPITGYHVQYSSTGGAPWTDGPTSALTSTSTIATVAGLVDGTSYVFRVAALNAVGTGPYSPASAPVTPQATSSGGSSSPGPTTSPTPTATPTPSPTSTPTPSPTPTPTSTTSSGPTNVTLSSGPDRTIDDGEQTTIGTSLSPDEDASFARSTNPTADGGLSGAHVQLFARAVGRDHWRLIRNLLTNAQGRVATKVRPIHNTEYEWRYDGSSTYSASTSATQTITVRNVVSVHRTAARTRRGGAVQIYGQVTPVQAGETVMLQLRVSGSWVNLGSAITHKQVLPDGSNAIGYVLTYTGERAGRYTLRVQAASTRRNATGNSHRLVLHVT